ncbi:YhdH/YhfP family quinone oxidoreductase [Gilvimarinus agarilyticus]|uniref:YhdH/YhfP family quinone oxidoreductase n=1 Tax=Gilvimarinus sp. 2_MG-2023 TaxID=3062666 RepID=UPI001C092457|nr:YhdH/YhfP family quinone oxidoreductase [Gilvimarinus sp. 2_MG-2023]MBU2887083.1 YhdH/YhfP family quinone oxidoreductase [Gilvimarinus agarilyticus]MDO6571742.1 YhdH/YhfP family quinone oxidoreductase [Gilvimarinus sp. 2_MG-2023]
MKEFSAVRVEAQDGLYQCQLQSVNVDQLASAGVLIKIVCSALNYKDALSASGHPGVTRNFPHTPGIDAAGIVVEDSSDQFKAGARVIVSGFDFGMNSDGGLAEYCRVPAEWVCPCPDKLSFFNAMALGTAGITVATALNKLERQVPTAKAGDDFVISGASGGVGSVAIKLAAARGYCVTAMSSRPDEFHRLKALGARHCIDSGSWRERSPKPLLKPEFSLGLDTLGGPMLENLLKVIRPEGALATCGMALSEQCQTTVYPFILRGVSLLGVDSAEIPLQLKAQLWEMLSSLALDYHDLATEVTLEQAPKILQQMLAGKAQGRTVVRVAEESSS